MADLKQESGFLNVTADAGVYSAASKVTAVLKCLHHTGCILDHLQEDKSKARTAAGVKAEIAAAVSAGVVIPACVLRLANLAKNHWDYGFQKEAKASKKARTGAG